ncbi:transglycosylase domain-containing protein [Crassaminicella profunda]|uniref:transglycosylase domain-containing protein n=1 Tax=Crassaminicella profunda TaxID=1286698 RepID=UPI001CA71DAE|nr:biosynthetic peptidoglycan transglycosylase [Crassaminicella profunda]QZY53689.1 transglycosylase domain-containing protein [Crassaminicella profunda]
MKKITIFLLIFISFLIGVNSYACQIKSDKYVIDEDLMKQISSNIPNYTNIDQIPKDLKNAIVAVEDRRFYKHDGFDMIGIGRAFWVNIKEGSIKEGGSTITQQLAKNLFLSGEKTYTRKLKELILAIKLENRYSKEEILEMYLNVIYYGAGAYGIQNASKIYYDKDVWALSLEECAMLAGLVQAPSAYNPKKHFKRAKKRQEIVLMVMEKNGFIHEKIKEITQKKMIIIAQ